MHRRRAVVDAIVVGTGTVFTDDPTLTARLPDGSLAAPFTTGGMPRAWRIGNQPTIAAIDA